MIVQRVPHGVERLVVGSQEQNGRNSAVREAEGERRGQRVPVRVHGRNVRYDTVVPACP